MRVCVHLGGGLCTWDGLGGRGCGCVMSRVVRPASHLTHRIFWQGQEEGPVFLPAPFV